MHRPSPRARTIGLSAAAAAAVALFAQSLAGLAGIDGELSAAVSAERDPVVVPVAEHRGRSTREADCRAHDRRGSRPRVQL